MYKDCCEHFAKEQEGGGIIGDRFSPMINLGNFSKFITNCPWCGKKIEKRAQKLAQEAEKKKKEQILGNQALSPKVHNELSITAYNVHYVKLANSNATRYSGKSRL